MRLFLKISTYIITGFAKDKFMHKSRWIGEIETNFIQHSWDFTKRDFPNGILLSNKLLNVFFNLVSQYCCIETFLANH